MVGISWREYLRHGIVPLNFYGEEQSGGAWKLLFAIRFPGNIYNMIIAAAFGGGSCGSCELVAVAVMLLQLWQLSNECCGSWEVTAVEVKLLQLWHLRGGSCGSCELTAVAVMLLQLWQLSIESCGS